MDFDYSPRQKELMRRVSDFMDEHIYPAVPIYEQQARRRASAGRSSRSSRS